MLMDEQIYNSTWNGSNISTIVAERKKHSPQCKLLVAIF